MEQNNAVHTITDVALKLKRIENQSQLFQIELRRLLDSKAEGSIKVINKWEKEMNELIREIDKIEEKKLSIVKAMKAFVDLKFKSEFDEEKGNDKWSKSPLYKRGGKDEGAVG